MTPLLVVPIPILCGESWAGIGKEKTTPCVAKSAAMTSDLPNIIAVSNDYEQQVNEAWNQIESARS
jgi:hypothetical protein